VAANERSRKFKINWSEVRRWIGIVFGESKPRVCFQVFDDRGEHPEWAEYRHGRLSDREMRRWLARMNRKGCGVYACINPTDGKGRRRFNIIEGRTVWADFDGTELPEGWPVEPSMLCESSPRRYHAFWAIYADRDLNRLSECQARLAAFYGTDPSITDPSRVCRVPGFYHRKKEPFLSRIVNSADPETLDGEGFDRYLLETIEHAHPCEYQGPTRRAKEGRSEEPEHGWDSDIDVTRARYYLRAAPPSIEGQRGNDNAFRVACHLNDLGISPEKSLELMLEPGGWNERCEPEWSCEGLEGIIANACRYKARSAGVESGAADFDDPLDDEQFNGNSRDPGRKTGKVANGLHYDIASDIKAESIDWLWKFRIAIGKISMLAGFPDQGKSQIAMNIAATVSRGGEWPNGEGKAEQGAVVILSAEDDAADTLIPRLIAAGADMNQIIALTSMVKDQGGNRVFSIADDLVRLSALMQHEKANTRNVKLLIVDPISAYMGGKNKTDTFRNSDVRALLTPLAEWLGRHRVGSILISHFNKGGSGSALYRVTDSLAFTAAARIVWLTAAEPGTDRKLMLKGKSNLGPDPGGLAYKIEGVDIGDGITAPRIVWDGPVNITADEALNATRTKEDSGTALDQGRSVPLRSAGRRSGGKCGFIQSCQRCWTYLSNASPRQTKSRYQTREKRRSGSRWRLVLAAT
jgi:hypothetical protein